MEQNHSNTLIGIAIVLISVAFFAGKELGFNKAVKEVCSEANYKTEYCAKFRAEGMTQELYGSSKYEP